MLTELAAELDVWFVERALEARQAGMAPPRACTIMVHGQMALLEREARLNLVATHDVDVRADFDHAARKEFERLLAKRDLVLDPVGPKRGCPRRRSTKPFSRGRS